MTLTHIGGIGLEALRGELADRLEHRQPLALAADEALRGQRREVVDGCAADGFGRVERETPDQHAEPGEDVLLALIEKVVAPRDRVPKRLLPRRQVSSSSGQKLEPLVEPREQLLGRQQGNARRCELEGKRQPVETGADRDYRGGVVRRRLEGRAHRSSPRHEQLDGWRPHERVDVGRSIGRRERQGVHRHHALGGEADGLAAGDEQRHPGRVAEEVGEIACCVEHLLEVVEHEQDALLAEIAEQRLASGLVDPQSLRRGGDNERRIEDRSQRHEEDAAGERLDQLGRDLERETRFSCSTRSRQRDDACIGSTDELTQLLDLSLATEERRRLSRKVRRPVVERSKRRKLREQAVDDQLVETLRLAEILEAMQAQVGEREARPAAVEELARRLRDEHLAAVRRRTDPRAAVDPEANVPAVARVG